MLEPIHVVILQLIPVVLTYIFSTMASNSDFVQYIADQCSQAGEIMTKKMFGDYGINTKKAPTLRLGLGDTTLRYLISFPFYPTWLPGLTSLVVVTTLRLSSASTAERIIPWLSMPIILRGAKLATKRMRLPMSSSGFS